MKYPSNETCASNGIKNDNLPYWALGGRVLGGYLCTSSSRANCCLRGRFLNFTPTFVANIEAYLFLSSTDSQTFSTENSLRWIPVLLSIISTCQLLKRHCSQRHLKEIPLELTLITWPIPSGQIVTASGNSCRCCFLRF